MTFYVFPCILRVDSTIYLSPFTFMLSVWLTNMDQKFYFFLNSELSTFSKFPFHYTMNKKFDEFYQAKVSAVDTWCQYFNSFSFNCSISSFRCHCSKIIKQFNSMFF